jgi:hypothetical protein
VLKTCGNVVETLKQEKKNNKINQQHCKVQQDFIVLHEMIDNQTAEVLFGFKLVVQLFGTFASSRCCNNDNKLS